MKLLVLFFLTATTFAIEIPANFKTCNRNDGNFKSCLLEAAQYGITQLNRPYKELKLPSFDPLIIPQIIASVEVPLVNISSVLENCKFYGFVDTKLDKFDFDFESKQIQIAGVFPEIKSECFYVIDGNIFLAPIKGEGYSSATFKNFKWNFNLNYEEVKRRSHTYVKAISSSFDGKPESISFNLDDLFGGDKDLGQRVNQIINDNWSELYDNVRGPYLDNAKQTLMQVFNGWFNRVSLEEAFDN